MPHQNQSPKLRPPVDLSVSAGLRPPESTPIKTPIASIFNAPITSITSDNDEPSNLVKTPIKPRTPIRPRKLVITTTSEFDNPADIPDNLEEPITTPAIASTPVDNLDDNLIIPQHNPENPVTPRYLDSRVKLRYLEINDKPEEAKPPVVYRKISGRTAQIILNSDYSTYILSTDFTNAGNIPYFPYKPIFIELAIRNTSQFTLNTQTKKLPIEVSSITQLKASYILPLLSYNAIFGILFLNSQKLIIYPEKNIVILDDIELPLARNYNDERFSISMILRGRLKAEIRRNEITELYLTTTKISDPDLAPDNTITLS